MTDKQRESFEQFIRNAGISKISLERNAEDGKYTTFSVMLAWEGFKLGRASIAAECPVEAVADAAALIRSSVALAAKYTPDEKVLQGLALEHAQQLESFLALVNSEVGK